MPNKIRGEGREKFICIEICYLIAIVSYTLPIWQRKRIKSARVGTFLLISLLGVITGTTLYLFFGQRESIILFNGDIKNK